MVFAETFLPRSSEARRMQYRPRQPVRKEENREFMLPQHSALFSIGSGGAGHEALKGWRGGGGGGGRVVDGRKQFFGPRPYCRHKTPFYQKGTPIVPWRERP